MSRYVPFRQLVFALAGCCSLAAVMLVAVVLEPRHHLASQTVDDVRAYCTAVQTVDEPDARRAGGELPVAVRAAAVEKFDEEIVVHNQVLWRCMDGEIWWCMFWGTNWCPSRDTSEEPTRRMMDLCEAGTGDRELSRAERGRATIWRWECRGGEPAISGILGDALDSRGFTAALWKRLPP